jgi:riboflavin kinase/FMN adenylyltransferase
MLGRPYGFSGAVIPGHGVGRTMGFPTANIKPDPGVLIPGNGVYASGVRVKDAWYGSMTDIGLRPTARRNQTASGVESHLFDLDREIYGERVRIVLLERIRDERFFENWDALRDQLRRDEEAARRLLKDHHFPRGIV